MNRRLILVLLCAFAAAVVVASPFVGARPFSPAAGWAADEGSWVATVFWNMRLPRVMTGFLAGACLSLGGLAFQAL